MNYTIRPEEHELRQAKQEVETALETSKAVIGKEKNFEVSLGWMPLTDEEDRGATGGSGDEEFIFIEFNTSTENWKDDVRKVTSYAYGRSLFLERTEQEIRFGWQELLIEAFSLHFLEKVYSDAEEDLEWDRRELEEYWPQVKESLDNEAAWYEPDDPIWSAAYFIGGKLLEQHKLEELPELKRTDIIKAGDEVFE